MGGNWAFIQNKIILREHAALEKFLKTTSATEYRHMQVLIFINIELTFILKYL